MDQFRFPKNNGTENACCQVHSLAKLLHIRIRSSDQRTPVHFRVISCLDGGGVLNEVEELVVVLIDSFTSSRLTLSVHFLFELLLGS